MFEQGGLILLSVDSQAAGGGFVFSWPIASVLVSVIAALVAVVCWFIKRECDSLKAADKETDEKLNKNFTFLIKQTSSIDRRVARIEGHFDLGSLTASSPIQLTATGLDILGKSGVKEAADKYKDKLLEAIKAENPGTAYDVQELTRRLFQTFDFGQGFTERLKNYCFQSGKWGLSDVLDVGAIYFRDIALRELGFKYEDLESKKS